MQMTIEERIERLERENRWLKRIWVGAALVMACCFVATVTSGVRAQTEATPRIVEAEKFVLKDAQGHVRGEFGTSNNGETVSLKLFDAAGRTRASLAGDKDGASLGVLDAAGRMRASVMAVKDTGLLGVFDATGKQGALLTGDKDGTSLRMDDATGKRAFIKLDKNGPAISMLDTSGRALVDLSIDAESRAGLKLNDASGKQGAAIAIIDHMPELFLLDADHKMRTFLSLDKDGPSLSFLDAAGKERASLSSNSNGVELKISDSQGFSTSIGNTGLVTPATGDTHRTSAASIRMFNDKGDVIWTAPTQ